jgi:cyclopropane fatty-acyl-phospholipid synthase-like methyltransferase
MRPSYDIIFKYSDILNPISAKTLFLAGKLAEMEPRKVILDLGSGKGFPSLLWASMFGIQVEGFDIMKNYVEYANKRAEMLNLSDRVKFLCKDIKTLKVAKEYDVIAFLGLGMTHIFGNIIDSLKKLQTMLSKDGFLILAEPVWLIKNVPSEVLENLEVKEEHFLTKSKLQRLLKKSGFHVKRSFDSTKEDWEFYIQPINHAMNEFVESGSELAEEAQKVIRNFKAEYEAASQYWDMVLWVAKKI